MHGSATGARNSDGTGGGPGRPADRAPRPPSPGTLRVGAAKVPVGPPAGHELPPPFTGIDAPIFVRAVVVDDGTSRAALVSADILGLTGDVAAMIADRVATDHGIPAERLVLAATHTHSVPRELGPGLVDPIVDAIGRAVAALVPATLAVGLGECHINVNRTLFDTGIGQWREGRNDQGPSDKSLAVLVFRALDGAPLAVWYQYAVHAVVTGLRDHLNPDIPGVACAHVEAALGPDVVALFSMGCAGDQNPIVYRHTVELRARRVAEHAARGIDIANDMPPGGAGLDRDDPVVARLLAGQQQVADALGLVLAEEVLSIVAERCDRPRTAVGIAGAQRVLELPGRRRTDAGRAGRPGEYVDAEPQPLLVGVLRLGDVVLGSVDAELFTEIGQRFRRESPARYSLLSTLTNGWATTGYVASDTAGGFHTFEVLASRLQPGRAEGAIVRTLLDLARQTA